jgi:hypothetical protein
MTDIKIYATPKEHFSNKKKPSKTTMSINN